LIDDSISHTRVTVAGTDGLKYVEKPDAVLSTTGDEGGGATNTADNSQLPVKGEAPAPAAPLMHLQPKDPNATA